MEWIASHWELILVFTLIHFSLGRSFSVLFAIFKELPVFLYFPLALVYDYVQIPVYGIILEHSSRSFFLIQGRVEGTLLLMTGSFIGIFIIMGIAKGIFRIIALF